MASAITLGAATLEQQVYEVCTRTAAAIATFAAANPTVPLTGFSVRQTVDLANNRAQFTISLPITQSFSTDGGIEIDATEMLVAPLD